VTYGLVRQKQGRAPNPTQLMLNVGRLRPKEGNMVRTVNKSPEEKAWAKYFYARFENMSCPDALTMLAIKDAFRFAFKEAAQLHMHGDSAEGCGFCGASETIAVCAACREPITPSA
jgi:hypothetical protein